MSKVRGAHIAQQNYVVQPLADEQYAQARTKAEQILEEAKSAAHLYLKQAKDKADALLKQAALQAEQTKSQGEQSVESLQANAKDEGYEAGRQEGKEEGLAEAKAESEALLVNAKRLSESAYQLKARALKDFRHDAVAIMQACLNSVLGPVTQVSDEVLKGLFEEAVTQLQLEGHLDLVLHPVVLNVLEEGGLANELTQLKHFNFVTDDAITEDSLYVISGDKRYHVTPSAQFKRLLEPLKSSLPFPDSLNEALDNPDTIEESLLDLDQAAESTTHPLLSEESLADLEEPISTPEANPPPSEESIEDDSQATEIEVTDEAYSFDTVEELTPEVTMSSSDPVELTLEDTTVSNEEISDITGANPAEGNEEEDSALVLPFEPLTDEAFSLDPEPLRFESSVLETAVEAPASSPIIEEPQPFESLAAEGTDEFLPVPEPLPENPEPLTIEPSIEETTAEAPAFEYEDLL